ncbi:MAG: molybdopterin oxidoreductase family protein, partial [Solirubrobacteraceae bacterium]
VARTLAAPELQATVPDIEHAHTVLVFGCDPREDSPILDLRIRKGVRRNRVKLAIATARPTSLEANATASVRYAPGAEAEFAVALERAVGGADDVSEDVRGLAALLRDGGEDVVIMFSERIGGAAASALIRLARRLGLAAREGAGLLALPAGSNGRGLREAGAVPDAGPGHSAVDAAGRSAAEIAAAAADGEITALHLFGTDPIRNEPNRALWERALHSAALVVAHASVLTEGLAEHATVVFPAESHAEKEGTTVHPDGRLQRLRIAIAHPGEVRAGWRVLSDIAAGCGLDFGLEHPGDAFDLLAAAVPFYDGLSLEEIGGHGVRWPERPQSATMALESAPDLPEAPPPPRDDTSPVGMLALGTYRPLWAAPEVEVSPALKYLVPDQHVELSPEDARRLQIADGEEVVVGQNGTRLHARAHVRSLIPAGTAFLAEGLATDSANALTATAVEVHKP